MCQSARELKGFGKIFQGNNIESQLGNLFEQ
jgi:hypothetical protein